MRSARLFVSAFATLLFVLASPAADMRDAVPSTPAKPLNQMKAQAVSELNRLPLRFEPNWGQSDPRVKFLARGPGYTLFLTSDEAVLSLASPHSQLSAKRNRVGESELPVSDRKIVRMHLLGAQPGEMQPGSLQSGVTSYFIGNNPKNWIKGIPGYNRVLYKSVYPGVDLAFYGNPQALEYDFTAAPGADLSKIQFAFEGAEKIEKLLSGDLLLTLNGQPVTLHKPVAYQVVSSQRVDTQFVLRADGRIGFQLGSYDRSMPLTIDPSLTYSTYFGGSTYDEPLGIAIDSKGNIVIAGDTGSADFPIANALTGTKPSPFGSTSFFVSKLDSLGQTLIFSTYVGGTFRDSGCFIPGSNSLALDSLDNVYVAGCIFSGDFPLVQALQAPHGAPDLDAGVFKLRADGQALLFSTALGGSGRDWAFGMALDSAGDIILGGQTTSADFPTLNSLSGVTPSSGMYEYIGGAWTQINSGLNARNIQSVAVDPVTPTNILVGAFGGGVYRSVDGGAHWLLSDSGLPATISNSPLNIRALAFDPSNPSNVYLATADGPFKSTDGGATWASLPESPCSTSLLNPVNTIAVDPANGAILVAAIVNKICRSADGGATWQSALSNVGVSKFTFDPNNPNRVYAAAVQGVYVSNDAGVTWALISSLAVASATAVAVDPTTSNIVYVTSTANGLYKSIDGGVTWTLISGPNFGPFAVANDVVISPTNHNNIYIVAGHGIFRSSDGAATLDPRELTNNNFIRIAVVGGTNDILYTGTANDFDGWVAKLSPSGPGYSLAYSTYIPGDSSEGVDDVATDSSGDAIAVGYTNSLTGFPVVNAFQATLTAGSACFVTKLNPAGSAYVFSTYLGGSANHNDSCSGAATDSGGNIWVTGSATSPTFPLLNPVQATYGGNGDIFLSKFSPTGVLSYSTFWGGSSEDDGGYLWVDTSSNVYFTGTTFSSDFPLVSPSQAAPGFASGSGGSNAVVMKLNSAGTVQFSTYLGGSAQDSGQGITVSSGAAGADMFVVGQTFSPNFPLASVVAYQSTDKTGGNGTNFIAKFAQFPPMVKLSATSLSFGSVALGATSPVQSVTATNTGGETLQIKASEIACTAASPCAIQSGGVPTGFLAWSNCAAAMLPGDSCQIFVELAPVAVGPAAGQVQIDDNAPNTPQIITLSGTGNTAVGSTTTLGSSLNPSVYSQPITLTATITPTFPLPTGTVTFKDGAAILASVPVDGTGHASFSPGGVPTINSISLNNMTSTLAPTPSCEDTIPLDACSVLGITAADPSVESLANPFLNNADGSITALPLGTYWTWLAGDPFWGWTPQVITGPVAQAVVGLSDGSTLTSYFQVGDWNTPGPWTLISGSNLISISSTGITNQDKMKSGDPGTANFFWLGSDGRTEGILAMTIAPLSDALAVGSHSLTAVYSGDANYTGSGSAVLTQNVTLAGSTITVSSTSSPAVIGQSVTFTATLASQFGGLATGSVTFQDGTTVLGVAPVSGNTATLSTSTLAVGGHSITAVYSGDTNSSGSTSTVFNQSIVLQPSTTGVSASLNPALYSQPVTFTATITSAGSVSGSVTFMDGTATIGVSPVVGNTAATSTTLSPGTHSITAVFSGNPTTAGSTSPSLNEVINGAQGAVERFLVTDAIRGIVRVFNVADGSEVLPPISTVGAARSIALSPNGRLAFVSTTAVPYVSVVDLSIGAEVNRIKVAGVNTLAMSNDGSQVFGVAGGGVFIVDARTLQLVHPGVLYTDGIPVGATAIGVAQVGSKLYVNTSTQVVAVDLNTFAVSNLSGTNIGTLSSGLGGGKIDTTADGQYIVALRPNNLLVISSTNNSVIANLALPSQASNIAINRNATGHGGSIAYVTLSDGSIRPVDLNAGSPTFGQFLSAGVNLGINGTNVVRVNADGSRVFVAGVQSTTPNFGVIDVLDTAAILSSSGNAVLSTIVGDVDAGQFRGLATGYTVNQPLPTAPVVTSFSPNEVGSDIAQVVQVNGSNFVRASVVASASPAIPDYQAQTTFVDSGHLSISIGALSQTRTYNAVVTNPNITFSGPITSVDVRFTNDSCTGCGSPGATDRNLFVNSITIGSTTIAGNDPSVSFTNSANQPTCNGFFNGVASLFCNGDVITTNPAISGQVQSVTVNAYGTPDQSIYPHFQLFVNGTLVGQFNVTATAQNYRVLLVLNNSSTNPILLDQQSGFLANAVTIDPPSAFQPTRPAVVQTVGSGRGQTLISRTGTPISLPPVQLVSPGGIAVSPDGLRAYIDTDLLGPVGSGGILVSRLDTAQFEKTILLTPNDTLFGNIAIAANPLSAGGSALFFMDSVSGATAIGMLDVNPSSPTFHTVIRTIIGPANSGNGNAMAVTPDGRFAYIAGTNNGTSSLFVYDVVNQASTSVPSGALFQNFPNQLAITPDGQSLLTETSTGALAVFDVAANPANPSLLTVITPTVPAGFSSIKLDSYQVVGNRLFAADAIDNVVEAYNFDRSTMNFSYLGSVVSPDPIDPNYGAGGIPGLPAMVASPDGLLYLPMEDFDEVEVLDGNKVAASDPTALVARVGTGINPTLLAIAPTAPSITTVASSLNPSTYGQLVTFTATVSAATTSSAVPTGQVTFSNGAATLGTATLDGTGHASLGSTALGASQHNIVASYGGDGVFGSSSSAPMAQVISQQPTSTNVVPSLNPALIGQPVTFTGTVTPQYGGALSGSIAFQDAGVTIATMPLATNAASFTTSGLTVGNHTITAVYSGDSNSLGSTSPSINQAEQFASALVTPSQLDFGDVGLNFTSPGQNVTITSTGTGNLVFSSFTTSDPQFAISNNTCPPALAPPLSCTVTITATPASAGPVITGMLFVADNAADSPQTVGLSVQGTQTTSTVTQPLSPTAPNTFTFPNTTYNYGVQYPPGTNFSGITMSVTAATVTPASVQQRLLGSNFPTAQCVVYGGTGGSCTVFQVKCVPTACPATPNITVKTAFDTDQTIINPGFLQAPSGTNNWKNIFTAFYAAKLDPTVHGNTDGFSDFVVVDLGTPLPQFALTTAVNQSAGGSVSPATSSTYPAGTIVSLQATPANGYSFTGWAGPVANPNAASTTVQLNADTTVTANFSNAIVSGTVSLSASATVVKLGNGGYQATITVTNKGTGTAQNVALSAATLGGVSGTPLPIVIGNIAPGGGSTTAIVTFPPNAGSSGTLTPLRFSGTYTGGSFGGSLRITLPF